MNELVGEVVKGDESIFEVLGEEVSWDECESLMGGLLFKKFFVLFCFFIFACVVVVCMVFIDWEWFLGEFGLDLISCFYFRAELW